MTRSDSHRLCFIKRPGTRSPPPAVIFMVWAKCKSPSQSRQSSHYTITSYQSVLSCQTALAWLTLEWTAQRSLASSTHFLGSRDTELWDTTGKFGLFVVSSGFLIAAGGLKSQHTEHSLLLSLSALLSDKPEAGLSKWGSQSVYHWEGTSQLAAWRGFSFCHHGWLLQSDKTDGGQQDAGNFTRVVTNLSRSLYQTNIFHTTPAQASKWSSKETLLMPEMFGMVSCMLQAWELSKAFSERNQDDESHLTLLNIPVDHPILSPLERFSKLQSKLNNSRIVKRNNNNFLVLSSDLWLNNRRRENWILNWSLHEIPFTLFEGNIPGESEGWGERYVNIAPVTGASS